jgi:nitronate monooxygenase
MAFATDLTERLGVTHPIIQAPMAGGGDTPELVAAVGEAGGFGIIGAAYLTSAQIREAAGRVRERSSRPFGVNLFAPTPAPGIPDDTGPALQRVTPFFGEVGLPAPKPPEPPVDRFDEQVAAVLESGASVFSFTFGMPSEQVIRAIKSKGLLLVGTATTVDEAVALQKAGFDAVVAQGSEAGGHRGTFAAAFDEALVGTMALVPQVVDAVNIPVIASGGIMDGRGVAAALILGASAVQIGTAFLTCAESGIGQAYRQAILSARENETRVTTAFSGRPARGIVNRFMNEVEKGGDAILPFPLQNALTRPLRTAAAQQGRAEFLSLWAGQGVRLARTQTAAELVGLLVLEAEKAVGRLSR